MNSNPNFYNVVIAYQKLDVSFLYYGEWGWRADFPSPSNNSDNSNFRITRG